MAYGIRNRSLFNHTLKVNPWACFRLTIIIFIKWRVAQIIIRKSQDLIFFNCHFHYFYQMIRISRFLVHKFYYVISLQCIITPSKIKFIIFGTFEGKNSCQHFYPKRESVYQIYGAILSSVANMQISGKFFLSFAIFEFIINWLEFSPSYWESRDKVWSLNKTMVNVHSLLWLLFFCEKNCFPFKNKRNSILLFFLGNPRNES